MILIKVVSLEVVSVNSSVVTKGKFVARLLKLIEDDAILSEDCEELVYKFEFIGWEFVV